MDFLQNIYKHFVCERHVKAAVEKQGKVFDPEMMKVILVNSVSSAVQLDCFAWLYLVKFIPCNSNKNCYGCSSNKT